MSGGEHRAGIHVTDYGEDVLVANEFLRDCGRARAIGFVVALSDTQRLTADSTGVVDFLHGQVDSAARHDPVALFPRSSCADEINVRRAAAAREHQ